MQNNKKNTLKVNSKDKISKSFIFQKQETRNDLGIVLDIMWLSLV